MTDNPRDLIAENARLRSVISFAAESLEENEAAVIAYCILKGALEEPEPISDADLPTDVRGCIQEADAMVGALWTDLFNKDLIKPDGADYFDKWRERIRALGEIIDMEKFTHQQWQEVALAFSKTQPSSPQWFALVDAVISHLLQDRIAATAPVSNGDQ